jgi:ABC-type phosphate/phosphonate transport system permease subunit
LQIKEERTTKPELSATIFELVILSTPFMLKNNNNLEQKKLRWVLREGHNFIRKDKDIILTKLLFLLLGM